MENAELLFPPDQISESSNIHVTFSIKPPDDNEISQAVNQKSPRLRKPSNKEDNNDYELLVKQKFDLLNEIEEMRSVNDSLKQQIESMTEQLDKEKANEINDYKLFLDKKDDAIQEERRLKLTKKLSSLQLEEQELDAQYNFFNTIFTKSAEKDLCAYIKMQNFNIEKLFVDIDQISQRLDLYSNELNGNFADKQQSFAQNKQKISNLKSMLKKSKKDEEDLKSQVNEISNSIIIPEVLESERDELMRQLSILKHRKLKRINERDHLLKMHVSKIQELKTTTEQKKRDQMRYLNQRDKFNSMMKKKKDAERQRLLNIYRQNKLNAKNTDDNVSDWNEITFVTNAKDESYFNEDEEDEDDSIPSDFDDDEIEIIEIIGFDDQNDKEQDNEDDIKNKNEDNNKNDEYANEDKAKINKKKKEKNENDDNNKIDDKNMKEQTNKQNEDITIDKAKSAKKTANKKGNENIVQSNNYENQQNQTENRITENTKLNDKNNKNKQKRKTKADLQKEKELKLEAETALIAKSLLNSNDSENSDFNEKEISSRNSVQIDEKSSASSNEFEEDYIETIETSSSDIKKENESIKDDDESDQFEEDEVEKLENLDDVFEEDENEEISDQDKENDEEGSNKSENKEVEIEWDDDDDDNKSSDNDDGKKENESNSNKESDSDKECASNKEIEFEWDDDDDNNKRSDNEENEIEWEEDEENDDEKNETHNDESSSSIDNKNENKCTFEEDEDDYKSEKENGEKNNDKSNNAEVEIEEDSSIAEIGNDSDIDFITD